MTIRCPCGFEIKGSGEVDRSENLKAHLMNDHGQDEGSLWMLRVREELDDDTAQALMKLDLSMRTHLAPASRTQEEVLKDSLSCGGVTCVSEIPLSREQREDYGERIICPVCGKKVGGDDDEDLNKNLAEHCQEHERLRESISYMTVPSR